MYYNKCLTLSRLHQDVKLRVNAPPTSMWSVDRLTYSVPCDTEFDG